MLLFQILLIFLALLQNLTNFLGMAIDSRLHGVGQSHLLIRKPLHFHLNFKNLVAELVYAGGGVLFFLLSMFQQIKEGISEGVVVAYTLLKFLVKFSDLG